MLYMFGGGGWSHFGDIARPQQLVGPYDNTVTHLIDVSGGHGYWDVGPGFQFSVGGVNVYAEGRYMTVMTSGKRSHMFPVYGGLKFRFGSLSDP
jgi:hypothetical protein